MGARLKFWRRSRIRRQISLECITTAPPPNLTHNYTILPATQAKRAKKVVSDSLGLVDFAIGLVIFVLCFFGEIQITEGL